MPELRTEPGGLIWVCVDCFLIHHGYDEHELGALPDCEPWALWAGEPYDMADGGACEPDECAAHRERLDVDCECSTVTFSWSPCEGCGSTLGGTRHAFTYFPTERV